MYNMQLHYDNRYVQRIQNWQHCGFFFTFLFSRAHVCVCVCVCVCARARARARVKFSHRREVSFKLLINQCVSYVSKLGTLI